MSKKAMWSILFLLFFSFVCVYGQTKKVIGESYIETTNKKLQQINDSVNAIREAEGWNELIEKSNRQQEKERIEQLKNDSIRKELEYKAKATLIDKQISENFRNKMIGCLLVLLSFALMFLIIRWLYKKIRRNKRYTNINFQGITQKGYILISVSVGLMCSIVAGSVLKTTNYYTLYRGGSIRVSKELSNFELHEFNYSLSIVCFILISGICYIFLNNKSKE